MLQRSSQYSSDAKKFASLSLVWALVAVAAYAALPWVWSKNATVSGALPTGGLTGWEFTAALAQKGLGAIQGAQSTSLSDPRTLTFFVLIMLIPVALLLALVTSVLIRGHVLSLTVMRLYILAGIIGLVATLAFFIPYVFSNPTNQKNFEFSFLVVVATSIVARLQKWLRNLFQNNPAVASIGLLAVSWGTLWLANQGTITQVILQQIGIWLALAAFGIVLWSGLKLRREAIRANRAARPAHAAARR